MARLHLNEPQSGSQIFSRVKLTFICFKCFEKDLRGGKGERKKEKYGGKEVERKRKMARKRQKERETWEWITEERERRGGEEAERKRKKKKERERGKKEK